jgi:hypothetical protein
MAEFRIKCALPECGADAIVRQPTARYCCAAHRSRAYRQEQKAMIESLRALVAARA